MNDELISVPELRFHVLQKLVYKVENTAIGIRHADYVAPSFRKSWH
jgi:hypothetical protein